MSLFYKALFFLVLCFFTLESWATDLQGFLFNREILAGDVDPETLKKKSVITVYSNPSKESKVIATISRSKIATSSGKPLDLPEIYYEEKAMPVFQKQVDWYLIGLAENEFHGEQLKGPYPVKGWVNTQGSYKSVLEIIKEALIELNHWDGKLYVEPGSQKKIPVKIIRPKISGKARLTPEHLKGTNGKNCEIPFYSEAGHEAPSLGVCPQNFESHVSGIKCEEASSLKQYGAKDLRYLFCWDIVVLNVSVDQYQVALTDQTFTSKKISVGKGFNRDKDFGYVTAWVDKKYFLPLTPAKKEDLLEYEVALVGQEIEDPRGAEVLEVKSVKNVDWLKVKIRKTCGDGQTYGEGWVPLQGKDKVEILMFSRGC